MITQTLGARPFHSLNNHDRLDLTILISSSILLIKNSLNNNEKNIFLMQVNNKLKKIEELFDQIIFENQLEDFQNERQQLTELCELISSECVHLFDSSSKIYESKVLKKWTKFKWLLLAFDHYQYVKIELIKWAKTYTRYYLILRDESLDLPWSEFCQLVSPLINLFHDDTELTIKLQDHFLYSQKEILLFLKQRNASPKELITEVSFPDKTEEYGFKKYGFNDSVPIQNTQAHLRIAFNYNSFPEFIDYNPVDYSIIRVAHRLPVISKKTYHQFGSDELHFALKIFDKYYQGDPISLTFYSNIIKHLGYAQPGIKTINFCSYLPPEISKNKIKELLAAFSGPDQRFTFNSNRFPRYPRKLLKTLVDSDLTFYEGGLQIKPLDSDVLKITTDLFFEIIYPSLDLSKKENTLTEVIKSLNSLHDDKGQIIPTSKQIHQIHCNKAVIRNASKYYEELDLITMNKLDNFDLFFLFSRAKVECGKVRETIAEIQQESPLNTTDWKQLFVKWNVTYNPV